MDWIEQIGIRLAGLLDWIDWFVDGQDWIELAGLHWIHRIGLDWLDSGTLNSFLFEAHSGSPEHPEIVCV